MRPHFLVFSVTKNWKSGNRQIGSKLQFLNSMRVVCLLFFLSIAQIARPQIHISCIHPQHISNIVFESYRTGDTLYRTETCAADFNIPGLKYNEALIMIINGNRKDRKIVTVDTSVVNINLSYDTLTQKINVRFDSSSFNFYYSAFKNELAAVKNLEINALNAITNTNSAIVNDSLQYLADSLRQYISRKWYHFYQIHTESFLALDYVLFNLQSGGDIPKAECKTLFQKLSPKLAVYDEWRLCRILLESEWKPIEEGDVIPDIILNSAGGDRASFKKILEKQNLIVFWAKWCKGCLEEIRTLEEHKDLLSKMNIAIILINVEKNPDGSLLQLHHSYHLPDGLSNPALKLFNLQYIPLALLISQSGELLDGHVMLDKLLAGKQ
jgi:thiol-disulfide isomerase/thioredoxin